MHMQLMHRHTCMCTLRSKLKCCILLLWQQKPSNCLGKDRDTWRQKPRSCSVAAGGLNGGPSSHFPGKIDGVGQHRPHCPVAACSAPVWAHSAPLSRLRGSGPLSSGCGRSPSRLWLPGLPISTQHCSVSMSTPWLLSAAPSPMRSLLLCLPQYESPPSAMHSLLLASLFHLQSRVPQKNHPHVLSPLRNITIQGAGPIGCGTSI